MVRSMFLLALFLVLLMTPASWQIDKTLQRQEKGHDVVVKVISKIDSSGIFPKDNNFLHRVAWQESKDGDHRNTFRPGYHGGIWQVDEIGFKDTQNTNAHLTLSDKHQKIEERYGIDWMKVQWSDLEIPLYSGLAARLLISNKPATIPPTLEKQAAYWKTYYNSEEGKGTVEEFIANNKDHEKTYSCFAKRDLCFILDGSGSVARADFNKAKQFLWEISNGISLGQDKTHVSMIVYSSKPNLIFKDLYNSELVQGEILGAAYPGGGTNTAGALRYALSDVYPFFRSQSGILPVFMVLTDGASESFSITVEAAREVAGKGITTISVGIGNGVFERELLEIANGINTNVFLSSFEILDSILKLLEDSTCMTPAPVEVDKEKVSLELGSQQSTFVKVTLPPEGVTISVDIVNGDVTGYVSYTESTPNSAVYDEIVRPGEKKFFSYRTVKSISRRTRRESDTANATLYTGFTSGLQDSNVFKLAVLTGKHDGAINLMANWNLLASVLALLFLLH